MSANEARHESRACAVAAGGAGATPLRYELVRAGESPLAAGVPRNEPPFTLEFLAGERFAVPNCLDT